MHSESGRPHGHLQKPFVVRRLSTDKYAGFMQIPASVSDGHCFLFLTSGEVIADMDGESLLISPNTILFIPAGKSFSIKYHSGGIGYMGTFADSFLKDSRYSVIHANSPVLIDVPDADAVFMEMLLGKLADMQFTDDSSKNVCQAITDAFLAYSDSIGHIGRNWRINKICSRFFESLFNRERKIFHMSYYADEIGISPNHLNRVLKANTGRTAGSWIDISRVTYSKTLLRQTGLPIIDVAERVGFDDQSYFSRFFKKHCGMTPSRFRNSCAVKSKMHE